ncbi:MAG: PAS domain S-box protein [Proteobacteria bacterium]|nr:PAS domain S-box protein [Pseudomonadota bacterium]
MKRKVITGSLHRKYILLFGITLLTITGSFLVIGNQVYKLHLKREASTVVNQVIAFRRWVANTGGIWVNKIHIDFDDYLFKREYPGKGNDTFYAKNPALATREFSKIYSQLSVGTTFRVTSNNFRKAENRPDLFELRSIQLFQEDKSLSQIDSFIGNDYRYVQPIKIVQSCLKCHGKPEDAPKELRLKYGEEKAFGYKVGDVRGVISVTIPHVDFFSVMNSFELGVIAFSVSAIAGIMLLNFIWFRMMVSHPLNKLTEATKEIAKGEFTKKIAISRRKTDIESQDEMERLGTAFNRMTDTLQETTVSLDYVDNIITSMVDMLIVVNPDTTIKTVNQATLDKLGYEEGELIGKNIGGLFKESPWKTGAAETENLVKKGIVQSMEMTLLAKNGSKILVLFSSASMQDEDDQIQGIVCVAQDITGRVNLEMALKKSEELYRLVTETISSCVITIDAESNILFVNQATEKVFGYTLSEMIGQKITMLMPEHLRHHHKSSLNRYLETGKRHLSWEALEVFGLHKNGSEFPLEISFGEIIKEGNHFFTGVVRDMTERKQLEIKLRQSQKMEALGTLAGGIAHDFNNILGAILGNVEMCLIEQKDDGKGKQYLENISNASNRAVSLVKQVLTFSRMDPMQVQSINLAAVLQESLKMVRATIPTNIEIRQDIHQDCGNIMADVTQTQQIILNICTNAYHAMEEKGGILNISLKQAKSCPLPVGTENQLCLILSIRDTGCGISAEDQEKIFDPFYTTKEIGKGTGLGLAVVHGIVKQYGGEITVDSELGKGTTVDVFFPVVILEDVEEEPEKVESIRQGAGHILIVDDEPALTSLYETFLTHLGYTATVCGDSSDALELFKDNPYKYDLVLTDQGMPNLTGKQLSQALLAIRADVIIILVTGYSDTISESEAQAIGIRKYVLKPVNLLKLSQTIEECLKVE